MATAESDSAPTVPICLSDLENYTEKILDKATWGYINNGAADELTLRDNLEAFDRYVSL